MASRAADDRRIESFGQALQSCRRLALDDRDVLDTKLRCILTDEFNRFFFALHSVDMTRLRQKRRLDGKRPRAGADIANDIIFSDLRPRQCQDANLLLRHRHFAADEFFVFDA